MGEALKKMPEEKENVDEKRQSSGAEGEKKESEGEAKADPLPPPPPEEVVMKVYMHCEACARKVKRCLRRFEGVEGVVANSRDHIVVVKGKKAAENPISVVERVQRKCGRRVELISPILNQEPETKDEVIKNEETKPAVMESQVITVVLRVHMHCEACSKEIKKRILKIKGVQEAEPDLMSSELRVKGVFDPEKLVEYIRKRTGKYVMVLKQELPPPPAEQKPEEEENILEEEKNIVENKLEGEGEAEVKSADKATEAMGDGKEETEKEEEAEVKSADEATEAKSDDEKEETEKEEESEDENEEAGAPPAEIPVVAAAIVDSSGKVVGFMRKNDFHYYYPLHPIEHSYPPQFFSDENPNACIVM